MTLHEQFIARAIKKYGPDAYNYDNVQYKNAHTKVEIFCNTCHNAFSIAPMHFTKPASKGCNKCTKRTAYTNEEFIEKCIQFYGSKFSYDRTNYKRRADKVLIFCNQHEGYIDMFGTTLLKGIATCAICNGKILTQETFLKKASSVHGDVYDYTNTVYEHSDKKIEIKCSRHGVFSQTPKSHLTGRGCPQCGKYGYQPNKPGTFYVQKLVSDVGVFYKFGITGDMTRRINEQRRKSSYEHEIIVKLDFDNGTIPLKIENEIKATIPYCVVTESTLPSGFTETFDEEHLTEVLDIISKYK